MTRFLLIYIHIQVTLNWNVKQQASEQLIFRNVKLYFLLFVFLCFEHIVLLCNKLMFLLPVCV